MLQNTLSRAVWYWAAVNAAVLDEQERRRQQELQEQEQGRRPRRGLSPASLDSVRSVWRRLTTGSASAEEPAQPGRSGPETSDRPLLRRQRACVEEV